MCPNFNSSLLSDLPRVRLAFGSTLQPSNMKENDDVYFECEIRAKPWVYKIEWKFEVGKQGFLIGLQTSRFLSHIRVLAAFVRLAGPSFATSVAYYHWPRVDRFPVRRNSNKSSQTRR